MTDKHLDMQTLLAAARRGLSPTAADEERVRRSMQAALLDPAVSPGEQAAASGFPPAGLGAGRRAWTWLGRLLALGAVAAAAGGVGYRAGQRADRRTMELGGAPRAVPTEPTVPVIVDADRSRSFPPAAFPSSASAPPVMLRPMKPIARRSTAAHALSPAPSNPETLAEELRALRGAERALREDHPGLALALLRELDRLVPNGRLAEERLAVRTIARCASGDVPFGVSLAQDFSEHYPGSLYDRRVTDACTATDPSPSGDLSGRRNR